ncbi:MAG: hypothetical protein WA584_12460 [Pyrinomonadaceae bacterium]
MNFYDFLIIYLACGAPLGVYYFLQNRKSPKTEQHWLKTLLHFIFWMPFAYRLLRQSTLFLSAFSNVFGGTNTLDAQIEKRIHLIQKRLEKMFLESGLKLSIYEVREILDRYVGLTLECQFEQANSQTARTANEIFHIAAHKNAALAEICLQRRNRKRLSFHQTEARRDFLNLISELFRIDSMNEPDRLAAIEFATLLNDEEARYVIEKMFERETQTVEAPNVKNTETAIWKSETQKPLLTKPISTRLKAMTAATSLRGKD